jgi:hypothetical protein
VFIKEAAEKSVAAVNILAEKQQEVVVHMDTVLLDALIPAIHVMLRTDSG